MIFSYDVLPLRQGVKLSSQKCPLNDLFHYPRRVKDEKVPKIEWFHIMSHLPIKVNDKAKIPFSFSSKP